MEKISLVVIAVFVLLIAYFGGRMVWVIGRYRVQGMLLRLHLR